jgi:hypothetical protein
MGVLFLVGGSADSLSVRVMVPSKSVKKMILGLGSVSSVEGNGMVGGLRGRVMRSAVRMLNEAVISSGRRSSQRSNLVFRNNSRSNSFLSSRSSREFAW